MQFKNKKRKGFTIVEILIVVVIIGILAALVVPRMIDATKDAKVNSALGQHRTVIGQINSVVATAPEIVMGVDADANDASKKTMAGELVKAFGVKYKNGVLTSDNAKTTITFDAAKKEYKIETVGVGITLNPDGKPEAGGTDKGKVVDLIKLPK